METVQVALFKSKGIAAALIRWFTFSRWNHAGIRVKGLYYESTFRQGVTWRFQSLPIEPTAHIEVIELEVTPEQAAEMVAFLDSQVGKGYDWRAIIALPWRKRWQRPSAWFCSELVAEALRVGGVSAVDRLPSHRITPRDLWVALPQ